MSWHVDEITAQRYVRAGTDGVTATSIEAHVITCDGCQAVVGRAVDADTLTSVWARIEDTLDQPQQRWLERLLERAGVSDTAVRIIGATTRAAWSFVLVVVASAALAILSATSSKDGDVAFAAFLLVAPLGPLMATATAFGRWVDPVYEVTRTVPMSMFRIIMIRAVSTAATAIVLTALVTPVLLDHGWMAAAWLMPALAMASALLALSSWLDTEAAALVVVLGWVSLLLSTRLASTDLLDLFATPLQLASLTLLTGAIAITFVRRPHFDHGGF